MRKLFSINHYTKNADVALLIVRVSIALLMLTHGIPKLAKLSEDPVQFMDVFGMGTRLSLSLAILAEVGCSLLVLLGLGTRLAVIPLSFTMAVVAFHVQADASFAKQELPLLYLLVFTVLFIMGSGRYSMDSLLLKKESNLRSNNMVLETL